jgi:hypothetical protein
MKCLVAQHPSTPTFQAPIKSKALGATETIQLYNQILLSWKKPWPKKMQERIFAQYTAI